jgi:hypothetical protein
VGSEEALQGLMTGDIVVARTRAAEGGVPEWTQVGLVIRPEDVGAPALRKPVILTAYGSLGELGHTVRMFGTNELAIVEGQVERRPELLAHLQSAVLSVQVRAADAAGSAVLAELRRGAPTPDDAADPSVGFQRLLDAAGQNPTALPAAPRRSCGVCGRALPCPDHS